MFACLGRASLAAGCLGVRVAVCACAAAVASPVAAVREALAVCACSRVMPAAQRPAEGVIPYDLNSPLFSDYADKYRFVKLPAGRTRRTATTTPSSSRSGTVIAKTFAYPATCRDPSKGRRLIETRILKREPDGWVGLPYIWNDEQTEATLDVAGDMVDVSWIHTDGRARTNNYIIPNANQCKGCHKEGEDVVPIGPKATAPQPRLCLSRRDGEPARALGTRWRRWPGARRPTRPRGWPCGTTRRAARSTTAPAPGSRSTAPTATIPTARPATPGSTCWPPSATRPPSASSRRPSPPGSARAAWLRHRPRPARSIDHGLSGSPRPTRAS